MRTSEGEKNRQLIGLIAKYKVMYELSEKQLCDTFQMTPKTWRRRKANVGSLSIEEFRRFVVRYNIPFSELEKII